ncbi:hypothetical protein GUJ93_ZPchr0009g1427 [Zizania palustris]|uniref:Uncharacterized protein n=1 Tax=Zizania palustris TaxID=103762 RepID=A0A8J5VNB3_ZIZPA|nr:hypothetical protein GUJ93_ZPchr0009g1427 [Zizania palustris]
MGGNPYHYSVLFPELGQNLKGARAARATARARRRRASRGPRHTGGPRGGPRQAGGAHAEGSGGVVGRTRSLTEEDLEELKGCLDLGFGFAYHEIPELCGTLPTLELCYSMTRRFLDEQREPGQEPAPPATPPLPNWRISGPGAFLHYLAC